MRNPIAIAFYALLLDQVFFYSVPIKFLVFFICILVALFLLTQAMFRLAVKSWVGATQSLIGALLIGIVLFTPVRILERGARHYFQFFLFENQYKEESKGALVSPKTAHKYREWVWERDGNVETVLAFDESDGIANRTVEDSSTHPCTNRVFPLKQHFYVEERFCP